MNRPAKRNHHTSNPRAGNQRSAASAQKGAAGGVPKVALVGCGAVANLYYGPALQTLAQANHVQVAALIDPDTHNRAKLQRLFPQAVGLTSLDGVDAADYDLAIVASPPRYHAQQTLQLLQAGVDVLCEKPMAITLVAAEAMVACAEANQRLLAIGLVRRFFPATQMIHSLLTRESLGPVQSFRYAEGEPFGWPVQSATYFQKETAQGGVLLDIGVHVLDLLTWWWGQPSDVRYADDAMGGIEANCRLQLQFAQGHAGEVRLSRDTTLANKLTIECARGTIHWQVKEPDKVQVIFADVALGLDGVVSPREDTDSLSLGEPVAGSFEQSFLNQLRNVVSAVQGQGDLRVTGADGLHSLQLIERCYRQRELMEMAWLDEREQKQARQFSRAHTTC